MDEDTSIINSKTRNEKIKNFLIDNKKTLISSITILIAIIISFYSYQIYLDKKRVQISNKYNSAVIDYQDTNKLITASKLKDIINSKDSTYSPLALYFIITLVKDKNLKIF